MMEAERDQAQRQITELQTRNPSTNDVVTESIHRPRTLKSFTPTELRAMLGLADDSRKTEWNHIRVCLRLVRDLSWLTLFRFAVS